LNRQFDRRLKKLEESLNAKNRPRIILVWRRAKIKLGGELTKGADPNLICPIALEAQENEACTEESQTP